ncbi:X8 domain [Sesbania bispinosa]|nr:X8 domain [Sesbania bispinosa]
MDSREARRVIQTSEVEGSTLMIFPSKCTRTTKQREFHTQRCRLWECIPHYGKRTFGNKRWFREIDWSKAPFYAYYKDFDIEGCPVPGPASCASNPRNWWEGVEADKKSQLSNKVLERKKTKRLTQVLNSPVKLPLPLPHLRLRLAAMKLTKWLLSVLFLIVATTVANTSGAFVGVNIGTDVSDLPSASNVVAILKAHQITHVRLCDANMHILRALSNTGIEVIVGVTDEEILKIGEFPSAAAAWVLTSVPNVAHVLVPAMNYLHKALVAANLHFRVKVSTPQSMNIIPRPFPPSTATFNSSWNSTIYQLLQFLKNTNSSYMLNAHPYYGYTSGDGIFPIEYALFQSLPSVKQIVDPNTLFHYNSMFDAMVDATYYSIEAFNFNNIPIVVTGTGWPSSGGANEPDANVKNAETYNNNLIRRVLNDSGTPSQPKLAINTYIYEMFNEDKRNGHVTEKNWDDADTEKLQAGLNWACGQGQANCAAIQAGRPCYFPNNVKSHASYAYNDYYQKMHNAGGTCDFDGTAMTTTEDPSHGSCKYAGSSNSSTGSGSLPSMALGHGDPAGASLKLQVSSLQHMLSSASVFFALVLF